MPFCYTIQSKAVAENYATSATPNTEIDAFFIKPGATRAVSLIALLVQGKGAGLTALSGIAFRLKVWPTTASTAGTAITPGPTDNRAPAAVATAAGGAAGGIGAVTSGTGTAAFRGGAGCSGSGPGGWSALNPDDGIVLDGGGDKSVDLYSASGLASLNYEVNCLKIQE
jgi:hypothetical protein